METGEKGKKENEGRAEKSFGKTYFSRWTRLESRSYVKVYEIGMFS